MKSCLQNLPRNEKPVAQLNEIGKKVLRADQAILKQDELHIFIDELQLGLADLNSMITRTYFQQMKVATAGLKATS